MKGASVQGMRYVGRRYDIMPVPPVADDTTWVPAGAIAIGVEQRVLDDEAVLANLARQGGGELEAIKAAPGMPLDDHGASIHVVDAVAGTEHLRFDCFEAEPHYHYIFPDKGYNLLIGIDEAAVGKAAAWAVGCLRTRLPEMLRRAGRADLAGALDAGLVTAALDEVEELLSDFSPAPGSSPG